MTQSLNDRMEFDHVIQVHADGRITDSPHYAPDVVGETVDKPWELLSGYTGQYGYNGSTMHPSEFVGGRMERDILERPGHYVVTDVRDDNGDLPDDGPIGWAVAYREK